MRISLGPKFSVVSVLLGSGAFVALAGPEENWPQWRGPTMTGSSSTAQPPLNWSETSNVRWKTAIPGVGDATPVIWGDKVFVLSAVPTGKKVEPKPAENPDSAAKADSAPPGGGPPGGRRGRGMGGAKPTEFLQFTVFCLDRQSGKVFWQQVAREAVPHEGAKDGDGTFASPSGVTDGEHYFAYFGSEGLYCFDMQGKQLWGKDFGKMRIAMGFGEGSSPALYKDKLIITWDNEDGSFITALDKKTGKEIWKTQRDEHTSWSTPLVVDHGGKAQVVTCATGKIRSYDLDSGKLIWECGGLTRNVIPTPVAGNEMVYCTSGFQGNALLAIRLDRTGDLTGTDAVAWSVKKGTPYVPSPLLCGERLYFVANNNPVLSCVDTKTGQPLFDSERIEGLQGVFASPVGAAGRVYLTGRNGVTVVLKQSDKLEVLATNPLDDHIDASPAVVGKDLFLRGRANLYCIAEK